MKLTFATVARSISFVVLAFLILGVFSSETKAQKVRLRGKVTPACSSGSSQWKFADIYADGNIAVQGSYNCRGAFIYDVSNPDSPVLSSWYNPGNNQQFLEAIVVGNRGYFGSGNSGGVHIVDLSNPSNPMLLGVVNSTSGNGFNSIHEMMVFEQGGATYLLENFNGTSNKILKVINVSNPAAPVFVRDLVPTEVQWVHAMHIRGDRLITSGWGNGSNRGKTEIYNIASIGTQAPTLLGTITDSSATVTAGNNMHSSWSSEDGNFLYSAREVTSSNGSSPGDIRTYDISDPSQPVLVNRVSMLALGLNAVTPHNPVVMGNRLYVSWYQAGLQVFDITTANSPTRIGQYDTYHQTFAPDPAELSLADEPWDLVCGSDAVQNLLPTTYNGAWAVFPFLGEDRVLIGDMTGGLLVVDATRAAAFPKNVVSDFDGDGKTDLSVYSPVTGLWQVEASSTGSVSTVGWGQAEDIHVAADYDGDGKSDHAIWRPSTGYWWFVMSGDGSRPAVNFGLAGDVPVPADYDADGRTDIAIWRPSTGVWYINQSSLGLRIIQWGSPGDKPFTGDFEGDGKADPAVWRPSSGVWYILQSSSSLPIYATFGLAGDQPLVADFDGDARSDVSVFRPSNGVWYIMNSASNTFTGYQFGLGEDLAIPADHDGDGKSDISVYRPSTNVWYRVNSSDGGFNIRQFGQSGDRPSTLSVQPQ